MIPICWRLVSASSAVRWRRRSSMCGWARHSAMASVTFSASERSWRSKKNENSCSRVGAAVCPCLWCQQRADQKEAKQAEDEHCAFQQQKAKQMPVPDSFQQRCGKGTGIFRRQCAPALSVAVRALHSIALHDRISDAGLYTHAFFQKKRMPIKVGKRYGEGT